ncbi:hypothetical protein DCC81_03985 [Chitinophaga parva]|uniref:Thioredoxin domain-containing protein n=1 Tax=Chitinophaga parva TaxID=2169414 RepID=A0A2T7BLV5_9BACT|nr:TlpA disulfide reductase family protein [Chitinophaga parva]PUZ28652.1 hypothetical protein DCC81_03985 [Chitinophaga parva]
MTKATLFFGALLGATLGNPAPKFTITGKVDGGQEGTKIYLRYADVGFAQRKNLDSAVLHNGSFTITGDASSPRFCEILFRDAKAHPSATYEDKIISVFVENSNIKIDAVYDSLGIELDGWRGQKHGFVKVSGSRSHDAYMAYDEVERSYSKRENELFDEYIKIINAKDDADMEERYHKGVPVTVQLDEAAAVDNDFNMRYIQNHTPDAVNAYIATSFLRSSDITTTQVDSLIRYFELSKDNGYLVSHFKEIAPGYQRTALGSEVLDMRFTDSSGKAHALRDYIGKGKYVMLECWASWCGPCRADIPHLKSMYRDFHPQGFEIISVSLDNVKDKWLKALDQEKMPWLQLSDLHAFDGGLPKAYHINAIPHCLLFDPQGKLITLNMRGSWMNRRLQEMYGDHFSKG